MPIDKFIESVHQSNGLLLISLIVIFGLLGAIFAKKIKLPSVTGYIFAGILLGDEVLGILPVNMLDNFNVIYSFGLGLMSLSIGAHLNLHKLRNSWRRVSSISFFQILFTAIFVFVGLYFLSNYNIATILLISTIAVSTAPASLLSVVKETKSKGVFVETLMPVIAFNNIAAILLFSTTGALIMMNSSGFNIENIAYQLIKNLVLPMGLGLFFGLILKFFSEKVIDSKKHVLLMVFLAVSITTSIANLIGLNIMIANMAVGALIINTSFHRNIILDVFEEIELFIVIVFFTIAGAHMHLSILPKIAGVVIIYFIFRVLGLYFGATFGAKIAKAPKRISNNIGIALVPQAAIVIGLVLMAKKMTALHQYVNIETLTTFALGTIVLNEVFGPILSKIALIRSGDANNKNPKLIDFIQEEFINHNLKSTKRDEAIIELTNFLISSHKASPKLREEIISTIIRRENESPTTIGLGIAIPHGVIPNGPKIWGAIGISKKGINFNNDSEKVFIDEPVQIVILIVTPQKYKDSLHLTILQEVSTIFSNFELRERIINANSALEVFEALNDFQGIVLKDYNLHD